MEVITKDQNSEVERLDGYNKPYWSALQVLAWAATLNKEIVSSLVERRNQANPSILDLSVMIAMYGINADNADLNSGLIKQKESQVYRLLEQGKLIASARNSSGDIEEIKPIEWADLRIDYGSNLAYRDGFRWRNLRFSKTSVLSIWKGSEAPSEPISVIVKSLPQGALLYLHEALRRIGTATGKRMSSDTVKQSLHIALREGALTAYGKLVTYKDSWKEGTVTTPDLKPIPKEVWQQFNSMEFEAWALDKDFLPVNIEDSSPVLRGGEWEPPFYDKPQIYSKDIDSWLGININWRDILKSAGADDYQRLLKSDTIQLCKFSCYFAGYKPENLENGDWLSLVGKDSSNAGTPGYYMGILETAEAEGYLKRRRDHQTSNPKRAYLKWVDMYQLLLSKNEVPHELMRTFYMNHGKENILVEKQSSESLTKKLRPKNKEVKALIQLMEKELGRRPQKSLCEAEIPRRLPAYYVSTTQIRRVWGEAYPMAKPGPIEQAEQ